MSLPRGRRVSVRIDDTYDFVRPPASTSPSASLGVDSHHSGEVGGIEFNNTPGGLLGAGSTNTMMADPGPATDGTIAVALPIANLPRTPASPPVVPALASTSTISSSMVIPPVALSIERPRASLDVSGMMAVGHGGGSSPSTSLLAPSRSFGGLVPSPSMNARGTVTFGGVPVPNTTGPDELQMKSPPVKKYKTPDQVYPLLVHGSSPINESFLREVVVLLRRRGEDGPAPLALERWCGTDMTTLPDVRAAELTVAKSTNFYAAPTTPWAQPSVHVQAPGPAVPTGANRSATATPIPNSTATPRTATPSARSSSIAGGASQNTGRDEKSGGAGAGGGGKRGSVVTGVAPEASLAHESMFGNESAQNAHELHQGGPDVLPPVMMLLLHLQPKVIGGMVGIRLSDIIGVSSHFGGGSAQPGGSLSPGMLSALSPGEVSLPPRSGLPPSEAPFDLQGVGSDSDSSQQRAAGGDQRGEGGGGNSQETAVRTFALPAEPDHASVVQRGPTPPRTQSEPPLERKDTASFDPALSHQSSASLTSAAKVTTAKVNDSAPHSSLKDAARDVIVQRANEHTQEIVQQQQHQHAHSSDDTDAANDLPHGIISHMSEAPPQGTADHQHHQEHLPTSSSSLPADGTNANAANAAPGNATLQWSGATPTPTKSLGSLHGGSALMSLGRSQLTTNAGLSHLGTSSLSTSGAKTSAGAGNNAGANAAGGGFNSLAATASALVARQRAKTHDDARRAREYRRSFQFLFDGAPFVTKQAKDLRCRVLVDSAGVVKDEQSAIIPPTDRRKADRRRHQRSTTSAPGDLPSGSHRRDNRSSRSQSEFQQRANQRSSSSALTKNPSGLIDSDAESPLSPLSPKSPLSMASPKSPQSPRSRINFDFSGPTESSGTFSYTGGAANVAANGGARGDDAANEMTTKSHDKECGKEEEPARAPVYVDVVCAGTVGSLYAPRRRLEVWVGAGSGDADSAQTSTGSFPKSSQQAKPIAQRFLNSNSPKPPQAPLASALPTPVPPAVVSPAGPPGISFTSANQNQNNDSRSSFESDEKGSSKERDAGKREKGRKGGSSSVASRRMKQRLTRGDSLLDDSFEGLSPETAPLSISKRRQTAMYRDSRRSTVSASPPGHPRRKTLAGSLSQSTPLQPSPKPPTNTAGSTNVPDIVLTQQSSTNVVDGSSAEATRARISERKRSVSPSHRGSLNPLANPGGPSSLGGSTSMRRLSNSSQASGAGYDSPPSTPKPVPLAPSWLVNGMLPSMLSPHIDVSATTNSNATMMHGKTIPTATTPTTRVSIDDRSSFDGECSARSFALDDAQPTPTNSAALARNGGGAFGGSANLGNSASQHRRLSLSDISHESSSAAPAAPPVALMATTGESEGRKGRGRRGSQVLFVSPPPRRPSPQSTSASQFPVDDDDDDLDVGFESKQFGMSSVNPKKNKAGGKSSSIPESGPVTSGSESGGRSDSEKSESGGANTAHGGGAGPHDDAAAVAKSNSGAIETSSTVVAVTEGTKIIRLRVTDFEPIGSETGCEWFLQTFQQLDDVDPNDGPFSSETATASGPVLLRAVNRRAIREEEARIQRQHQIAHARSTPNLPHALEKSARKATDGASASGKKTESFVPKRVGSSENTQRVHNESRREDNAQTTTSISAQLHAMSNEIILNKYLGTKAPPLSGAGGGQSTLSGDWSMSGVGVGGGGIVATTSNARLPLQTEEYLQFTNPELFDWCLGQSAVSMTTSIEAIASAMKAFRYSSAFSRTVKRIRIAVRRIQRFFRAIVTRRRGAVALALLAWRNNEHIFVQHLERLKVLCEKDGTGIHMVVNNALRDNAVVTETAKKKEIETVWTERKATWRAKFQEVSEEIEAWVANRNFSVFGDGDRRGTEFYQPEGAESSNFHRHAVMHSSGSGSVLSRTPSTSTRAEDSFCIEGSMTVEGREFDGADGEHDGESSTPRHNNRENGRSSSHVTGGGGGGVGGRSSSTNARGSNRSAFHSTIGNPKSASALQQAIRRRTAFDALDPREFTQLMSGVRFSFLISKEELHQRAERAIRAVVLGPGPAGIYQHSVLQVLTTYEYTPQEAAMRHLRILLSEKRSAEESVKVQRGFRGTTGRDAQAAMPASLTSPSVRGTKTSDDPSDGPRAGKYEGGSPSGGGGGLSAMSSNKKASPSPRRGPQRSAQALGPSTSSKGSSKAPGSLSGGGADEDTGELLTASTAMNLFIPVPHAISVLALKHRTVLELPPAKTSPGHPAPKTAPPKPSKEMSSPSTKSATMQSLSQQPSKEFRKSGDKQEAEVNVVEPVAPSVEPSPVKSFVLATAPQQVPARTTARREPGVDDDDEQDPSLSTPTSRSDKNNAAGAVSPDAVVAQFTESSPPSNHPSASRAATTMPNKKAGSAAVSSVGKGVSTAPKAKVKESASTESEKSKDFRIAEASLPAGVRLETQLAFLSPPSKKKTAQHDGVDTAFAQTVGAREGGGRHSQLQQPHSPARGAQAVSARTGLGPFEPPRRVLTKPPQSHTHHGPSPSRSSVASPKPSSVSKTPKVTTNETHVGDSSSQARGAKHGVGDGGGSASGPAGYQPSTLTSAKETQRTYHSTVEFAQALLGQPSSSQLSPRRDLTAPVPGSMLGTTSPSKTGLLAKSPRRLKSIGDGANGGRGPQQPTAELSLLEAHRREMNPTAQRTQAFMNSRRNETDVGTDHHASNEHNGSSAVVMNPSKSTMHERVESGDGRLDGGENGVLDESVDPERQKHIPATAGSSKQLRGPHGAALPGAAYVEKMLADHTAHGGDPFTGHALASLPKVITCDTPPEDVEVYPFGNRTAHRVADRELAQLHRQSGQPSSSSPAKVTQEVKQNPPLFKSVKSTAASTALAEVSPGQTAKQLFATPRRDGSSDDTAQEALGIDVLRPSVERPPEDLDEDKPGPPSPPPPQFIDRSELEQEEILVDYETSCPPRHTDASVKEQPISKTEAKAPDDEITPSVNDEQTEKEEATTSVSPSMRKTNATPSSPAPPPSGFAAFGLGAIERIFKRSEAFTATREVRPAAGMMNLHPPPPVLSPQQVGGPPPGQGSPATGDRHALISPASESVSGFVSASVLAAAIPTALVKSPDGRESSDDVHSPTGVDLDDTSGAPAGPVGLGNSGAAPPVQSAGQLSLQSSPPEKADIDPARLDGDHDPQIPPQPPLPHINNHHHHRQQQQVAQPQVDAAQWRATKRQREKDHVVALAAALAGTGVVHPASTFPTAPKPGTFSLEALLHEKERRQHRARMTDHVDDRDDLQSSNRTPGQNPQQQASLDKPHQQQSKQQQKTRGSTVGPFPPIAQTARGPEFIAASPQVPSGPQTHRGQRGTTVGRGAGGGALGLGGVLGGLKASPQKAQTARPHYTVKLPQLPPYA